MKFSDLIASTALATGLVKMYMDFENSADVDVKFKNSIIFGIVVTTTWLIYYTNQYGFSHFNVTHHHEFILFHSQIQRHAIDANIQQNLVEFTFRLN